MKKYIVTRTASIYIVVDAENEEDALNVASGNYGLEDYEIGAADDDAEVEEYAY